MMIGKCPYCKQRLIVDMPSLTKGEGRICEHCGQDYFLYILAREIWAPYEWWSYYSGFAMSAEGSIQDVSVDGTRIREPIYPEAETARFLGKDPRTLSRWRESSKIDYYRFGLSIFYGESHIRRWLQYHISNVAFPEEWQLELALDCMRKGHSPFSLQDAIEHGCTNGHWLSAKQMFTFLNGQIAKRTPSDGIVQKLLLILGGITDMTIASILTHKSLSRMVSYERD